MANSQISGSAIDSINPPPSDVVSYVDAWSGTPGISSRIKVLILKPPPPRSPSSTEFVVGPFSDPLIEAIEKLGNPSVILGSSELRCTTVKLPKDST